MNLKNNFRHSQRPVHERVHDDAYTAAYYGVPVTFLSGDEALCEFAKELIPGITTVAVNRGVGGAACSIHPAAAVREIREKAEASLANLDRCRLTLPDSFEMGGLLQGAPPGLQPLLLPRRPALGPHSGDFLLRRLVRGAALLPLCSQRLRSCPKNREGPAQSAGPSRLKMERGRKESFPFDMFIIIHLLPQVNRPR